MKISSLKDLHKFTNKISEIILPGDYLFLFGEIGVGKTTFARQLINVFELKNNIKKSEVPSPTFNILFEYELKDFIIKHYDLYRLKNEEEIKNLELFEIEEKNITLIEWPELIKNKPTNRIDLFFKYTKNMKQRVLNIKLAGRLKKYDFAVKNRSDGRQTPPNCSTIVHNRLPEYEHHPGIVECPTSAQPAVF